MTEDQLRILRDIHRRGLIVLYRYGGEYPSYDDEGEDDFPRADWHILRTQLGEWKHTKGGAFRTNERHIVTRRFVKDARIWVGEYEIYPDGTEVQGHVEVEGWDLIGGPEQVISEVHEHTADVHRYRGHSYWTSEYIEKEEISSEEWGIVHKYTLTEKALEAIGDQSK